MKSTHTLKSDASLALVIFKGYDNLDVNHASYLNCRKQTTFCDNLRKPPQFPQINKSHIGVEFETMYFFPWQFLPFCCSL